MNKEEINFLKEHIEGICRYKGLQQELTYDVSLDVLQRICLSLDYLQQTLDKTNDTLDTHCEMINHLQQKIDKAIEYIENHSLYEEEYDYDYEENSYLSGIDDEQAKRDLLEILKGSDKE